MIAVESEQRRLLHLTRLNRYYREGTLRLLVGAGVSMAAGYPDWNGLNTGLLKRWIDKDPPDLPMTSERLAREVFETLGRESAADYLWQVEDPGRGGEFFALLAAELYGGREPEQRVVPDVALQIAAMAEVAKVYTTNYDPVLELGLSVLRPADPRRWVEYRSSPQSGEPAVRHIHGWVDSDGHWGGAFVLAESHYLELQAAATARPNRDLASILDGDGAVLIVGMSLGDANLRRVLYQRSISSFATAPTYAVVRTTSSNADPYHAAYWRQRKTTLVFINDHDLLLPTLRDIQFGAASLGEVPRWLDKAGKWLEGTDNFTDGWQQLAWTTLRSVSDRVRQVYAIDRSEEIQISLFRLMADSGELQKVASTKPDKARTATEARAHAVKRRLNVRVGQEQGVAGRAFLTGLPVESVNRDES